MDAEAVLVRARDVKLNIARHAKILCIFTPLLGACTLNFKGATPFEGIERHYLYPLVYPRYLLRQRLLEV